MTASERGHRAGQNPYVDLRRLYSPCPNQWDRCLDGELDILARLEEHGGIRKVCCKPDLGGPKVEEPWINMPAGGRRFQQVGNISVATLLGAPGVETEIPGTRLQVPLGWDGVITTVLFIYTGNPPLVEASGDLVGRVAYNGPGTLATSYSPQSLGNITTTMGSLTNQYPLEGAGVRIYSMETLLFLATANNVGLNPAGRVIASLSGWFYPLR